MRTAIALAALAVTVFAASEPKIDTVLPEKILVSAKPQQVTVTGGDLLDGLTLVVRTPANKIAQLSGTEITGRTDKGFRASILFDEVGAYELMITNKDGGKSAPFRIDVRRAGEPPPVIERIQPEEIRRAQEPQVVTITGARFLPGMRVNLTDPTGTVKVTDVFDRLDSSVAVVKLLFEISGVYGLSVVNSSGESSNSISITIR